MERHEILEVMSELKLYGMHASFDEIAGKGLARRDEIYPLIASLIRAERIHRQAKSISYRISAAKIPVLKDLDSFVFTDTPVDEGLVRELAAGAFLDAKRNAIFIGGTGTGKTHLCIAVASAAGAGGPLGKKGPADRKEQISNKGRLKSRGSSPHPSRFRPQTTAKVVGGGSGQCIAFSLMLHDAPSLSRNVASSDPCSGFGASLKLRPRVSRAA